MRVLFIYPDILLGKGTYHQGLGYISSVLKQEGHDTFVYHIQNEISESELHQHINNIKPDLIGFTSSTNQYPFVRLYSKWIKEGFNVPVIVGGIHATLNPHQTIKNKNIDMVCVGEGEYPMLEVVNNLENGKRIDNIANLLIKQDSKLIENKVRPLIEDLDKLPFPDREVFSYDKILKNSFHTADFIAGRGCPYRCTYCCNHALGQLYEGLGNYIRFRSPLSVLNEIKEVTERYSVQRLTFRDDTFTLRPKWVREFCNLYKKEFDLPFQCNTRAETANKELFNNLKNAGCDRIQFGVESGNEWLRKSVLNRQMSNNHIIKAFSIAKDVGLETLAYIMIGFPFETKEMIEETISLVQLLNPDYIQISIFYPYPGTELFQICLENGFLTSKKKYSYAELGTTLNLDTLTEDQINYYYDILTDMAYEKNLKNKFQYTTYKILKLLCNNDVSRVRSLIKYIRKIISY